jgi:hypothetical protein
MLFENQDDAVNWLQNVGIGFNAEKSEGRPAHLTWTFTMPKRVYHSVPKPNACSDRFQDKAKEAEHKPKSFLEAINLFAEDLQIRDVLVFKPREEPGKAAE